MAAIGASPSIVWHNGRLAPADEVRLSPFDQGLTIGLGAFETLVASDGEPFAFTRHWDRLTRSCARLDLPLPDRDTILQAMRAVAAANGQPSARLRVTVTPGAGPLGSVRGASSDPTVLVVAAPLTLWPEVSNVWIATHTRHERSALAGVKSTSYAENVLALAEARARGADEALLLNTAGNVCEGTGSNLFLVAEGAIVTPPLIDGCLAGVTRALVLALARDSGLAVSENSVPLSALAAASEAFLTSTTRGIHPIRTVNGQPLTDAPGPVTQQLRHAWHTRFPRPDIDP